MTTISRPNPFADMRVGFNPRLFVGRSTEAETLWKGVLGQQPRSFSVSGPRGIGKTALLSYLTDPRGAGQAFSKLWDSHALVRGKPSHFLYCDFEGVTGDDVIPFLYGRILTLATEQPNLRDDFPTLPPRGSDSARVVFAREHIRSAAQSVGESFRLVVVMDGFDAASATLSADDVGCLIPVLPYWALVVATEKTARQLHEEREMLTVLFDKLNPIPHLGLLSRAESEALIARVLEGDGFGYTFSKPEISFLVEIAGGHPGLLVLTCEYFFDYAQRYPSVQGRLSGRLAAAAAEPSSLVEGIASDDVELATRLLRQMLAAPHIEHELFALWNGLRSEEQAVLELVSRGEQVPLESDAVYPLVETHRLLYFDEELERRFRIFSRLFEAYIRTRPLGRAKLDIEAIATRLSGLDASVLRYLAEHRGIVCAYDELGTVWPEPPANVRQSIAASIGRIATVIRDKYGSAGPYIENRRGEGYVLVT